MPAVSFTVHNVSTIPLKDKVSYNGQEIDAVVDCVEVEFVGCDRHGSFVARWTGAEGAEARAKYKAGDVVSVAL